MSSSESSPLNPSPEVSLPLPVAAPVALDIVGVSKHFRIPHEKVNSVRGMFANMFTRRTYTEFHALDDINFQVRQGEFLGIVGRNGSGKSTLLKIIAGVYEPDQGHVVRYAGIAPFLELGIGFNPELTGKENVYLNATILGLSDKQIEDKYDEIVAFAELEEFMDQKLSNYSSGMQVRLAFAVSIHANREILLMDEVLAVGDAPFQAKCLRTFEGYKRQGRTVVLVSHDIGVIRRYCDRALWIERGAVRMEGSATDIVDAYQESMRAATTSGDGVLARNTQYRTDIAQILQVRLVDTEGKVRTYYNNGETIVLEMDCVFHQEVLNPVFGILIYNNSRQAMYSSNTLLDPIKSELTGRLTARFSFPNFFGSGEYTATVAITKPDSTNTILDRHEDVAGFDSIGIKGGSSGVLDVPAKFTLTK